jgi:hypothetical protein
MTELAGPMAVAAVLAMFIAALRLLTDDDEGQGRTHVTITFPFLQYLLFHGLAAIMPFLPYRFWPESWLPLVSVSPWLVAVVAPLVVNQLLKLEGLDLPKATGPLSKFRDQLRRGFEHRMIEAEYVAMRTFTAPFAQDANLFVVREQMLRNIPPRLPATTANAFRDALRDTKTVEDAMELYIRHIGRKLFLHVFAKKQESEKPNLIPLPLFDEWEKRSRKARVATSESLLAITVESP